MNSLFKHPSAWIPIVLSLAVFMTMLISIAIAGAPHREIDEGTGAHLFQIWLVLEAIMILIFAINNLPEKPKEAFLILAIQIIAALAACAPIFYFGL